MKTIERVIFPALLSALFMQPCNLVLAAPSAIEVLQSADQNTTTPGVSPIRCIERDQVPERRQPPAEPSIRSIDGSGNNLDNPEMNATHTQLRRYLPADYADQISTLAAASRPGPREVSNAQAEQTAPIVNRLQVSDFLWQWGQFLDHDIDLTDGTDPTESADIPVPAGDPYFDPEGTGTQVMSVNRSAYDKFTGTNIGNPRQQINEVTGWIDASNVYGSDPERANALRTNDGTGRLNTSTGNMLPFNTEGLANAGGDSNTLFLAGDVRANEQVGLSAMHTLFVREHNRLAADIAERDPSLDGEEIYQQARRLVGALMQVITYREFLPILLGPDGISSYQGYDPMQDASIMNAFSTASYRMGHSLLSPQLLRLDANANEVAAGHLPLRDAFFRPDHLMAEGIDSLIRGLANQVCQDLDLYVVDDVRNFLFGDPGEGGFDLVSLNIQRGRDHGLPDYNSARQVLGLPRVENFEDISSDLEIQNRLTSVYDNVDDIDLWVGGLAEDHMQGAMVGQLIKRMLSLQFKALRDGDRFWYQRSLRVADRRMVENTTLADIIRRNTGIGSELQEDVFHVPTGRGVDSRSLP
ncbi:MAG: peroxidase family protein [Candidatus Thiodiazotropha sp. L084R]